MYRAKRKGRGCIELFDHTMRDEAIARLQLEDDLREALEQEQFALEYQPIVDTTTLEPVALEALIRWDHPTRGRLGPDAFIPVAEETGLITQIGNWVISTACDQLASWQSASPKLSQLRLSVNVSPVQLAVDGLVEHVANVLECSTLSPGSLWLEITESAIVADEAPDGRPHGIEGARSQDPARRLRHGLLVARLPHPFPDRHGQDRPLVHCQARR